MNYTSLLLISFFLSIIHISPATASDTAQTQAIEVVSHSQLKVSGMAALENGQFVKGNYAQVTMPGRLWLNRVYGQIMLNAKLNEFFTVTIAPEVKLWFDTYPWQTMSNLTSDNPFVQHSKVSLAQAVGTISLGNKDLAMVNVSAGVMPYKYNENAKNLGEYLFRSGTHPAFIYTSFDYDYAIINGLKLNCIAAKNISLDVLLTTETYVQPTLDWSLSFVAGYNVPELLQIRAGMMFNRLWPANLSTFRPIDTKNMYLTSTGEKRYFDFGGTKLVGCVNVDPKGIIPSSAKNIFGKEDGKFYAEAAVLGIQNFNAYKNVQDSSGNIIPNQVVLDSAQNFYSDITKRIPIMFGFNFPTFKLLDFLSVELEWYGWEYPNSFGNQGFQSVLPKPAPIQNGTNTYKEDDNWKYSFNVKKTLWKQLNIIAQVARDHTFHDIYYPTYDAKNNYQEVFSEKDNWGWWFKLQYNF